MSKGGKSIQTENKSGVTRGWGKVRGKRKELPMGVGFVPQG